MAEEKRETEPAAESTEPVAGAAKPAVKKKVAKKRVARKASVKKAAARKTAAPAGDAAASVASTPPVAAKDGVAERASSRVEAVVKLKEQEPVEETEMPNDTKTPVGFWLKVIFWLVVIVIGFIWIRSLAKHPGEEMDTAAQGEGRAATTLEAAASREASTTTVPTPQQSPDEETPAAAGVPAASSPVTAHPVEPPAAATPLSAGETGTTAGAVEGIAKPAQAPAPGERAGADDSREESVARILQEFDELRNAARADMEAMRKLIQAERDRREAMPPPAGYGGYPPPSPRYDP